MFYGKVHAYNDNIAGGRTDLHRVKSCFLLLLIFVSVSSYSSGAHDQSLFPDHALKIIVPYAKGGGTDSIARALGKSMAKIIGQPVYIENILGGSGAVGMISGAAAVPDGYTLTMVTRELVSLPALGLAEISKDDFKFLSLVNKDPAVLVVASGSPFSSLTQIIDSAKESPGKIKFASPAKPHFYILEFESRQDIFFNKLPYNGASQAITAILNGDADFTLVNPGEIKKWSQEGRVKILSIMSDLRIPDMPDVPTFKELGYDITSFTWRGLVVPLGTPEYIQKFLAKVVRSACSDPGFIHVMREEEYSVEYLDADGFLHFINKDIKTITTILKEIAEKGYSKGS